MGKWYVLKSQVTEDYNSNIPGKRTTDLNQAGLFTAADMIKYADAFSPNFIFVEVHKDKNGKVTLVG